MARLPLHLHAALADLFRAEAYLAESARRDSDADYLHAVADELHERMTSREYESAIDAWTGGA